MKRLAWITDPHLNFLDGKDAEAFYSALAETPADVFAVTGDIGEAPNVAMFLNALDDHLERPIYFVLGNHDFYRDGFDSVRKKITGLCHGLPPAALDTGCWRGPADRDGVPGWPRRLGGWEAWRLLEV